MPSNSNSSAIAGKNQKAGGTAGFAHIMVAVDESDQARYALAIASHLAEDLHAKLSLVHVVPAPIVTNPDFAYEAIPLASINLEAGKTFLDCIASEMHLPVKKIVCEGDAAAQIVESAKQHGANLLIVGTHGRGRFAAAVIGSVAHKVMQHSPCPVRCVAHAPVEPTCDDRKSSTREPLLDLSR